MTGALIGAAGIAMVCSAGALILLRVARAQERLAVRIGAVRGAADPGKLQAARVAPG